MHIPNIVSEIAAIIEADWKKVYFGARPYLDAMHKLKTIDQYYRMDDGRSIVCYFLGNARTWKGETAKAVKAKLNELIDNA
ncbi:MAG TPA: hypothetical protein VHW43_08260 [Puia sp.]|jgi:hypothetical protein|nr:hypothetical protein [Puia sp.]